LGISWSRYLFDNKQVPSAVFVTSLLVEEVLGSVLEPLKFDAKLQSFQISRDYSLKDNNNR